MGEERNLWKDLKEAPKELEDERSRNMKGQTVVKVLNRCMMIVFIIWLLLTASLFIPQLVLFQVAGLLASIYIVPVLAVLYSIQSMCLCCTGMIVYSTKNGRGRLIGNIVFIALLFWEGAGVLTYHRSLQLLAAVVGSCLAYFCFYIGYDIYLQRDGEITEKQEIRKGLIIVWIVFLAVVAVPLFARNTNGFRAPVEGVGEINLATMMLKEQPALKVVEYDGKNQPSAYLWYVAKEEDSDFIYLSSDRCRMRIDGEDYWVQHGIWEEHTFDEPLKGESYLPHAGVSQSLADSSEKTQEGEYTIYCVSYRENPLRDAAKRYIAYDSGEVTISYIETYVMDTYGNLTGYSALDRYKMGKDGVQEYSEYEGFQVLETDRNKILGEMGEKKENPEFPADIPAFNY
ncbi:hypothetical protein [Anaerolentibacter hominis]|uniref:hypothetical protein n=1 Tax=Anaerolentibacter hominis TaxID=3079009 RepID=UPI0031B83AA7